MSLPVAAATIEDPFFFVENRENAGFAPFVTLQVGAFVTPASVDGSASATFGVGGPGGVALNDFGNFSILGGPPRQLFERSFGLGFEASSITITVTDDSGSDQAIVGPASTGPASPLPLVSNVSVTGGNAPLVSWTNPGTASELEALGIDYIRVRAVDFSGDFINPFIAVTEDLSQTSIQLPDLAALISAEQAFIRIELVDDRDDEAVPGESFAVFTALTSYVFDEQNRSTFQIGTPLSQVPLPASALLLSLGLLGIGAYRRHRQVAGA
ncbi:MAG: VPLPA-CTERM sorting domain-containing protein [Pseudomonadota bacterium]